MNDMTPFSEAVAAKVKETSPPEPPPLPEFKPKWWYSKRRLDVRPLLWGLKHHPKEFTYDYHRFSDSSYSRLRHYRHVKTASGHTDAERHTFVKKFGWRLEDANCSCHQTTRKFQVGHSFLLRMALRQRRRSEFNADATAKQFASHFVHH